MKETFKTTTCCVGKRKRHTEKTCFTRMRLCVTIGVREKAPPDAVCVPNYKSFYGKRCTVGEPSKRWRPGRY